jgi:hypothetical protein
MKNQVSLFVGAALLTAVIACENQPMVDLTVENPGKGSRVANATGTLLFQTNFDNSAMSTTADPQRPDITGSNITGSAWTGTEFGNKFRFYYEDGNDTQRKAVITTDDGGSTNNILKYLISDVNVPSLSKARIQADLYDFNNTSTGQPYKEIYQSVRMKLHYSSFNKILLDNARLGAGYYSGDWITLFEFWNNDNWGSAYPFRISVGLKKLEPARNKFVLYADGQDIDVATSTWRHPPLWETSVTAASNAITLGTWMTVEIYFKEGTAGNNDGKFWLAVTPDGGTRQVICDYATGTKHILTQHPNDPAPNGLSHWNPMKLYTSAAIVNTVKGGSNPQTLQVYWDDYRLWKDKQPQ